MDATVTRASVSKRKLYGFAGNTINTK
jgi:hypothetical protein